MTLQNLLADCPDLSDYIAAGGGSGLDAAQQLGPLNVVEELVASGLRGRGGAGFPTGIKWRTVVANHSEASPTTVIVNAAEGEPGSFKDRAILRARPYAVLEGALIAGYVVGATRVVVATKSTFQQEIARLRQAVDAIRAAGWPGADAIEVFAGPSEYLYGEETALLEAVAGRAPFPRISPPFRQGVAGTAVPALVNNTETMASVAGILANGPSWFRSAGTNDSPGTTVFTVTGATRQHGVAELPLGTPVSEVIERVGGGARRGRRIVGVLSGVANPVLPSTMLDTPATYEDLEAAGGGLGSAGFIVIDDTDDMAAVAQGVARFLAVESCGQCTPCKQDGLAIASTLTKLCEGRAAEHDLAMLADLSATVSNEARCFLAHQHERVISSVLRLFGDDLRAHLSAVRAVPYLIVPITDFVDGVAILEERHAAKQPDWTFNETYSGQSPADRIDQGESRL